MSGERLFPSFGMSLLLEQLNEQMDASASSVGQSGQDLRQAVLDLVTRAIELENEHHLRAIENLIDSTGESLDAQIDSRKDTLDAYFQGLRDMEESAVPRPQKMLEEINGLVGLQLKLNNEQMRSLGEDPEEAKDHIQNLIAANLTAVYASRVIAAVQNRFGESIGDRFEISDWDDAEEKILVAAENALKNRRERLVGKNGQIGRDIDNLGPKDPSTDSGQSLNDTSKLQLLLSLSQGARTVFDQKTHRQVKQVFSRYSYVFLIARLFEGQETDQVVEDVLDHLEEAQEALQMAWGEREYARLASNALKLADFGEAAKRAFGEERLNEPASSLGESDREALIESIGKYVLNEVHRQLLLGATSELWVEYLTKIEALRVSISLEAYAQRDPLVQYKGRASEMFSQLVEDIRGLVISRVYAYRPKPIEITPVETADTPVTTQSPPSPGQGSKKKKRRRH
jgi:preprotein translocase subunit SecA